MLLTGTDSSSLLRPPAMLLFVYGSLTRAGSAHAALLQRHGHYLGLGVAQGRLARTGGFPALVSGSRGRVAGELYRVAALSGIWRRLDAYEGAAYSRVRLRLRSRGLGLVAAWVYVLRASAG